MNRLLIHGLIVALAAVSAGAAAHPQSRRTDGESLAIRDAWVRESTALRRSSSGYCRIENPTDTPVALVRIRVPGVGEAQVHAMTQRDGQMMMHPVSSLTIPAHGAVDLAPGGTHVMLTDIARPLTAGSTLDMQFTFDDGRTRTVRAVVRTLGAMSIR